MESPRKRKKIELVVSTWYVLGKSSIKYLVNDFISLFNKNIGAQLFWRDTFLSDNTYNICVGLSNLRRADNIVVFNMFLTIFQEILVH